MDMKRMNENKKAYLNGYREAKKELRRLESQLAELQSLLYAPSSPGNDGMPHGSGSSGDLSSYFVKEEKMVNEIKKQRCECDRKIKEIIDQINVLPDQNERDVLFYRYIKNMKWEEICVLLNYSWRQIMRLHGQALYHFRFRIK